jgi:transglutaminase-like putative cysteine protease
MWVMRLRAGAVCLALVIGWTPLDARGDVPRPASEDEIREMLSAAGDAKDYPGASLLYVLDEADVFVRRSGLATTESCQVIKVLTDAGIKAQSVLKIEYDPATNRIAIRSIRVHRKDGSTEDVDTSGMCTQPAPQWMIYWGNRQHVLSLPRLEVGDAVEIRTSKTGFNIAYLNEAGPHSGPYEAGPDSGPYEDGPHSGPYDAGPHSGPYEAGPHSGPYEAGPHSGTTSSPHSGPYDAGPHSGPYDAGPHSGPYDAGPDGGGEAPAGPVGAEGEPLQPPMPGHWYESTLFQAHHPIAHKRYSVHMPKDMPVQYEVYNGKVHNSVWFDGDHIVYSFWDDDVAAVKSEPSMVSLDDCAPKVVLATVGNWEAKSRWFWEANKDQFEADDAIRAKVTELTAHLSDPDAKIQACLNWVADNVRYYGTSRGPCEGFTLHSGIETFRDLGGVCKDKAGMLVTMLRVLGHNSYPALTMAGARVEDVPADQFNHTVTVIRDPDGAFRLLDPTWSPLSREWWSTREALQHLVYGTPEGEGLTHSPYFSPESNSLKVAAESAIDEHGALTTTIVMDLHGYPCTYFRRSVHRPPPIERRAAVEAALRLAPNARLERLEHTDPRDYARDSHVDMAVTAEGYAAGANATRLFVLPLLRHPLGDWLIPDFLDPVDAKERTFALRRRATRLVHYEETISLPEGWTVERVPESKTLDSGSAALSFEVHAETGRLRYVFEMRLKNHIIPAKDYPGWKEAVDAMNDLASQWVVCHAPAYEPAEEATR